MSTHLHHPPFLCRTPFLSLPFQFILAWDWHQICIPSGVVICTAQQCTGCTCTEISVSTKTLHINRLPVSGDVCFKLGNKNRTLKQNFLRLPMKQYTYYELLDTGGRETTCLLRSQWMKKGRESSNWCPLLHTHFTQITPWDSSRQLANPSTAGKWPGKLVSVCNIHTRKET